MYTKIITVIASAIAIMGIIGLGSAGAAPATAANDGVELSIAIPSSVTVDLMPILKNKGETDIAAQLVLKNTTGKNVTLHGSNACATHTWTVSDATGAVVQDASICQQIFMPVSLAIGANASFAEHRVVILDGPKYHDGQYTLHYNFWGHSAQALFTVTVVQ